jgi:hypothetical protein
MFVCSSTDRQSIFRRLPPNDCVTRIIISNSCAFQHIDADCRGYLYTSFRSFFSHHRRSLFYLFPLNFLCFYIFRSSIHPLVYSSKMNWSRLFADTAEHYIFSSSTDGFFRLVLPCSALNTNAKRFRQVLARNFDRWPPTVRLHL